MMKRRLVVWQAVLWNCIFQLINTKGCPIFADSIFFDLQQPESGGESLKVTFMFTSEDIKTDRKFVQTALMLYQSRHKTALEAAWFTNAVQYQTQNHTPSYCHTDQSGLTPFASIHI